MVDATRRFAERLGGAFALSVVLVSLAGLTAVAALHVTGPLPPPPDQSQAIESLRAVAARAVAAGRSYAAEPSPSWLASRSAAEATFSQELDRLKPALTSPDDQHALDLVDRSVRDLELALFRESADVDTALRTGADVTLRPEVDQRLGSLDRALNHLLAMERSDQLRADRQTRLAAQHARRVATAGATAAILLATGLGFLLIRRFAREFDGAQTAIRTRERFLAVATAQLGRPLAALTQQLGPLRQVIREAPAGPRSAIAPEAVAQALDNAAIELQRLAHLLDELRRATEYAAGSPCLHRENVDLAALARDVASGFDRTFRGQATSIWVRSHGTVLGLWDRQQLEEVLRQLFANAIAHGRGRVVNVSVEGGPQARVVVRDHGAGLAREVQAHLFDPFDSGAHVREPGHLGLGLYIARRIVEAHGGRLEVSSVPDVGSTFTVDLPRRPPTPAPGRKRALVRGEQSHA